MTYKKQIEELLSNSPFSIDRNIHFAGRVPSLASSEFLTNKEQGDWAEQVVFNAINDKNLEYVAVRYGRSDTLSAGDNGFAEFYSEYIRELNTIGKKPDILIFPRPFAESKEFDLNSDATVTQAVAALEVRSSSFLAKKYASYMDNRVQQAVRNCIRLRDEITSGQLGILLKEKNTETFKLISSANEMSFCDLNFRLSNWCSSSDLKTLSGKLKELKENIKVLNKRDYLSITPKLEDLALVNRWIQRYGVKHFYLQVFFDMAYVIPFKSILEITSNPLNKDKVFSVETDVKNQLKTTIKINVKVGREILGQIDMPTHNSTMKELSRGRLLFYVTFTGGKAKLEKDIFINEVVNGN